jgi:hypothetical protein
MIDEKVKIKCPIGIEDVPFASHQFIRQPFNRSHVIVKDGLLASIIPFDGNARPIPLSDGAKIGRRGSPANTVAHCECSGLVAGHFNPSLVLAAL